MARILFLLVFLPLIGQAESVEKLTKQQRDAEAAKRFAAYFNEEVEQINLTGTNLSGVIRWFRQDLPKGLNVIVLHRVLKSEKVFVDNAFDLVLSQTTRGTALRLAMEMSHSELRGYVFGNILKIGTRNYFNKEYSARLYYIRDLQMAIPDFDDAPTIGLEPPCANGRDAIFSGSNIGFGTPLTLDSTDPESVDARTKELINIIITTVNPETWEANGGKGTIKVFDGHLVIYNNIETHWKLSGRTP